MRVATFNVNGINGRLSVLLRWLEETEPDVVCLQELKASDARFPKVALEKAGFGAVWHGQKSWNGVAILGHGRFHRVFETQSALSTYWKEAGAMIDFHISNEGLHPRLVGLRRAEIDGIVGEQPTPSEPGLAGEEGVYYPSAFLRVVLRDSISVEVALIPPALVTFRNQPLFDSFETWREVVIADGDARECYGFIILPRLMLTMTGFHDNDAGQLAITSFERGRWDKFENSMKSFIP